MYKILMILADWVRERGWKRVAAFTLFVLPLPVVATIVGRQLVSN